jgi:phytol kinase
MIGNNWIALVITFVCSLAWLRLNDFFAHRGWISSPLSRKIIHMGTGPIFVLCWLLFNDAPSARYMAAIVPLAITIQFFLIGIGVIKDQAAVDGMSRSGDPKEILRGPLYYGIVFVVLTVWFWKDSPNGIIALMLLCGGDGLADVVGKRWGMVGLVWSPRKTAGGTIAMFMGGWIFALGIMAIYLSAGVFQGKISDYLFPITLISVIGMMIESLPLKDLDNVTVPIAAIITGFLSLPKF